MVVKTYKDQQSIYWNQKFYVICSKDAQRLALQILATARKIGSHDPIFLFFQNTIHILLIFVGLIAKIHKLFVYMCVCV